MLIDQYKDATVDVLKATIVVNEALLDVRADTTIKFGDKIGAHLRFETKSYKYGSHSWSRTEEVIDFTLKPDWYDTVCLNGIHKVTYNGKTNIILDAVPQPITTIKDEYASMNFEVFLVKLPIYTMGQFSYSQKSPPKSTLTIEDRFMVATPVGDTSRCYAAKTANIAAGNLKRSLMKDMQKMMGI